MANEFLPLQAAPFLLAGSGAIIGDTTLTLQSFTRIDGTPITMAILGLSAYMTIEPGNGTQEEQIVFTGVTQNTNGTATLTGVSDVTMQYPYTQTSGLLITHAGSTTAILSNTSGFYSRFIAKDDDGTISETLTFTNPNYPQIDTDSPEPTLNTQFVPKSYVDNVVVSGAPNANTTTKGIVQIATQAQVDAKTIIGLTSAVLVQPLNTQRSTLLSDYVIDTSTSPNIIIITPSPAITSYQTGQQFSFKVANTNTSPSVTLNVNGLGAKNFTTLNGTVSPSVGDIVLGGIINVEYDGTNFQVLNPVANAPATLAYVNSNFIKFGGTGNDGALTVTSGTTIINLGGASVFVKNYSSISITGTATIAFSNPAANGTIIIFKCAGNCTITSSATAAIDMTNATGAYTGSIGGSAGSAGTGGSSSGGGQGGSGASAVTAGTQGSGANITGPGGNGGGGNSFGTWNFVSITGGTGGLSNNTGNSAGGIITPALNSLSVAYSKVYLIPGSGGGGGGANNRGGEVPGIGGSGGGGLYMEVFGGLNITGTINASGQAGQPGTSTSTDRNGSGGGGGSVVILYNSLIANSATINVAGGGTGAGSFVGVAGANGFSAIVKNTEFD